MGADYSKRLLSITLPDDMGETSSITIDCATLSAAEWASMKRVLSVRNPKHGSYAIVVQNDSMSIEVTHVVIGEPAVFHNQVSAAIKEIRQKLNSRKDAVQCDKNGE